MSNQRTVLVESISYIGTDGESHVAHKGDKITVSAPDVAHFDWVHDASPEAQHAAAQKLYADAEKPAPAAKKADEKS